MKLMMKILATLVSFLLLMGKVLQAESVWIEGEKPVKSTMNRHPRWYDQVKKDQLSGGDWISNFDAKKPGEAEYSLTIKEGGAIRVLGSCQPHADEDPGNRPSPLAGEKTSEGSDVSSTGRGEPGSDAARSVRRTGGDGKTIEGSPDSVTTGNFVLLD